MSIKNIFFMFFAGLLFVSCDYNPLDIDASDEVVDVSFVNVDSVIANADSAELLMANAKYKSEITDAYDYLVSYCLQIGKVEDSAFYNSIMLYREDTGVKELNESITKNFSDVSGYSNEILGALKHLKYHLPKAKLPTHVVYINSLFASSIFCTENEIAIGLDRYLGENDPVVQKLNPMEFYGWIKKGMNQEFLTRDAITGWLETHIIDETESNIAEQMIRWGKIMYLTEAAYPEKSQATILRYSEEELIWAKENEYSFWQYLIDQNLLYSTDPRIIANIMNPGPTTSGLPTEGAPDRLGRYLGWKMVHQYIEFNELKVEDVVTADYKDILLNFEIED